MAVERGFWFRDQTSMRLGAWPISLTSPPSVTVVAAVSCLAAGTASSWRAETVKARRETRMLRASPPNTLNWDADMFGLLFVVGCNWNRETKGRR